MPLEVKLWGELACFTRAEAKAERVSYPVMPPSAARGALEAIFWQPEMRWEVREIHVLREPRFVSFVRNEVNSRASVASARSGYYADEDRAQRHTLALRDVAYIIKAEIVLTARGADEDPARYRDQFRRRVERGQCHFPPYLGCREFTANFGPVGPSDRAINWTQDLGWLLFDWDYEPDGSRATPVFFNARVEEGVLKIPQELYRKLRWCHAANKAG